MSSTVWTVAATRIRETYILRFLKDARCSVRIVEVRRRLDELLKGERQRQMQEHGEVGRRYAGTVKQIISGSIGFDDWEWGVDLFAEDPLVFKRLIYEMRFDQVSAVYALFGTFYIGKRLDAEGFRDLLTF